MSCPKLRNVDRFVDRHGKPRHYFRAGRGKRVRLPGEPGSAEFMLVYEAAARSLVTPAKSSHCRQGLEAADERS